MDADFENYILEKLQFRQYVKRLGLFGHALSERCLNVMTCGTDKVTVLATNHALPRHPVIAQRVRIAHHRCERTRAVRVERIDDEHANAKASWEPIGSPEHLDVGQIERLETSRRVAGKSSVCCA